MNEISQKVEEMVTFVQLTCHSCGYEQAAEEEETQLDEMSGTRGKPCPKCLHTMWEEE